MSETPAAGRADDVERYRTRLFGIAYRMLGDVAEAEDVVQEAYLRWHRAGRDDAASPEAWLVAVTTRLGIDRLRRLTTERAAYSGPWLPVPLAAGSLPPPDRHAELASELSLAFLVLLERLAPEERAAFLLRELFDADYAEIARVLERSEPAARQVVHRARERVRADRRRVAVPRATHAGLVRRFLAAVEAEDREALLALVAPEATFTSDGGGKVAAARRTVVGADRIARFLLGLERKWRHVTEHRLVELEGELAILTLALGERFAVTALESDGERITAAYRVMNPDKLRWIAAPG